METSTEKCANCGQELNADGTKHYNDIVFCAFVTAQINWNDWRTAKKPEERNDQTALSPGN